MDPTDARTATFLLEKNVALLHERRDRVLRRR
jgi:hypothetical protein